MARTPKITNEEILAAARQVFLEQGEGGSTLEIAQKAEAAKLRATVAEEQVQLERDRANTAEQKATIMAAKLRELGIELDL